jgi:hypothetical protein
MIIQQLKQREIGKIKFIDSPKNFKFREDFCEIAKCIEQLDEEILKKSEILKTSASRASLKIIETNVNKLCLKLMESNYNKSSESVRKQFLFYFHQLDGAKVFLKLLSSQFGAGDARNIDNFVVVKYSEIWNEILLILREVAIVLPIISENVFQDSDITFLFTFLAHKSVFDNSLNLLEEILSARSDSFSIVLIPNLFNLLETFTMLRLANFCRILNLILFEPDDRFLMESTQDLCSIALLQMRKNRIAKHNSCIVEKNQNLV